METITLFNIAFISLAIISVIETLGLLYILLFCRISKKPVKKEVRTNGIV
jgi:hypothetical protein